MKKSKLIELLNAIPGNPDILFWNGLVEDWMDIDKEIIQSKLYKDTLEYYLESVEQERKLSRLDLSYKLSPDDIVAMTKKYKSVVHWRDSDNFVEIDTKNYHTKNVAIMNVKSRGLSTYFRGKGKIGY
jgi:hypothetical protein